jgi:hypothetical protein
MNGSKMTQIRVPWLAFGAPLALVAASVALALPVAASPTVAPAASAAPKMLHHASGLSKEFQARSTSGIRVPSSVCNQYVGTANNSRVTLGSDGPSQTQTLVAIPINGGGSISSATTERRVTEECARRVP